MTEQKFEQLLREMREETAAPEEVRAARERVWQRLAGSASLACAGFRPELGDYLAGHLTPSRRLLIEDHIGRCHHCRRVLSEIKGQHQVAAMPQARSSIWGAQWPGWTRWAVAAGVVLAALYLGRNRIDSALAPSGPRATIVAVTGAAYRVRDPMPETAVQAGGAISEGEVIRTGAGSRAVLQLTDGSRVEMNQRSELTLQAAWSGRTIRLDRGDVIVTAAKQRRGTLRVVTRDSVASVKGTIFAVSSGAAGSLVSVVEGSVAVAQPGVKRILTSGQQASTNRALAGVPVRQAISWSQDAEKYYALLAEFLQIEKQLVDTAPDLRTEARLLRYLPGGVEAYFAIPNLTGTIRQALYVVDQRARENAALNEWWSSDRGLELKQTLDRMQAVTPLLGDEVVIVLVKDRVTARRKIALVLAQIQSGRQDALRQALERIAGDRRDRIPYQILAQDLLLVSESASDLAAIAAQLGAGAGSPFASEIARRYQAGMSWLAALDLAALSSEIQQREEARVLGMANMRYLFLEQRWGRGRDENEVTLSFRGARTGVASWLAPPGSAGSAEYVSSEAVMALSASTRDPRQAIEELLTGQQGDLARDIRKFEADTGINVGADIAASLGTDFTFAVERPTLPLPGWVAVFEVVRPAVLDDTVRRLVDDFNRRVAAEGVAGQKMTLTRETVNGRAWSALQARANTIHWTYDRGYLIASADRALASRAIAVRESGTPLVRSAGFLDRFPAAGGIHHSGFLWLNTSGLLADLASLVQSPGLRGLMASRDPILIVIDGETERIHAASRTRLTSLLLELVLAHGAAEKEGGTL